MKDDLFENFRTSKGDFIGTSELPTSFFEHAMPSIVENPLVDHTYLFVLHDHEDVQFLRGVMNLLDHNILPTESSISEFDNGCRLSRIIKELSENNIYVLGIDGPVNKDSERVRFSSPGKSYSKLRLRYLVIG